MTYSLHMFWKWNLTKIVRNELHKSSLFKVISNKLLKSNLIIIDKEIMIKNILFFFINSTNTNVFKLLILFII